MSTNDSVMIIGGHGKVARLLTPMLVADEHPVRSVIRNPDHAADVTALGAEPVIADVEQMNIEELAQLVRGQDTVVWSAGAGGGNPARTVAVDRDAAIRTIDAAVIAGVQRFLLVSFSGASVEHLQPEGHPFNTYMQAKIDADEHLHASPLDWTIIAPGTLTDEPSTGRVNPAASYRAGDEAPRELVAQVVHAAMHSARARRETLVFGAGDIPLQSWLPASTDAPDLLVD